MEKLVVIGNTPLKGEVNIGGAKNSAVAILPATILMSGICTLENVPNISDIKNICEILEDLGDYYVHVLVNGKIVKTGDKSLALEIDKNGYKDYLG